MADLQRNGNLEFVAFGVERIHFRVVQRDIETVDVHVDALEAMLFDRAVDFRERLLDAKGVVAGEPDEAVGITAGVLGDFFELGVHVHPLVAVRPHLGLGDKNFCHAGFVHFGEHGVETVELRQAADGFFHAANQLAFFRIVPALNKLRRGDVVHDVDGLIPFA